MIESNFSLLSQNEIDTLVSFLNNKKNSLNNETLNQESIDKLITLIRNNEINKFTLNTHSATADFAMDIISKLHLRENLDEFCELVYKINSETSYIELYATNTVTGKTIKVTPTVFDKLELIKDNTEWGYSVAPLVFDKIANLFNLKYTQNTYDEICKLYTLKNYGSDSIKISSIFFPDESQLLKHLQ